MVDVCNRAGWIPAAQVEPGHVPTTRASGTLADAVFVIDPGHGSPDKGALGPSGVPESRLNVEVAGRLAELLRAPRDIDWETGRVTGGSSVPAVASAVLTRPVDGPNGGDYEVGLSFRAELANSTDATAFISIHHNSAPVEHGRHRGLRFMSRLTTPSRHDSAGSSWTSSAVVWHGSATTGWVEAVTD